MGKKIITVSFMLLVVLLAGCGSKADKVVGVWKVGGSTDLKKVEFVEIGKDYIVLGDKREDGIILVDVDGVVMVQKAGTRQPESYIFGIEGFENDGNTMITFTRSGLRGDAKYRRVSEQEIRMHDKPKFEDIRGFWAKEGESEEGYNVVAFSKDVCYCDGKSILIVAKQGSRSTQLRVIRASDKHEGFLDVVQFDSNTIAMKFRRSKDWHTYKRMGNTEAKKAMAEYVDKTKLLGGYWKSVKPVNGELFQYMAIVLNPKGFDKVFKLKASADKSKWVREKSGYLGYAAGRINEPICLIRHESVSYPRFTIIDKNAVMCELARNEKVKLVRVAKGDMPEELVEKMGKWR